MAIKEHGKSNSTNNSVPSEIRHLISTTFKVPYMHLCEKLIIS